MTLLHPQCHHHTSYVTSTTQCEVMEHNTTQVWVGSLGRSVADRVCAPLLAACVDGALLAVLGDGADGEEELAGVLGVQDDAARKMVMQHLSR